MKISSTSDLSERDITIAFKVKTKRIKAQSFKNIRQKDWNRVGSIQQEENNNKKCFIDEGMERREVNTSTNLTKGHTMFMFNRTSPHI